ncbi:phosphoserine phosphatase SerB [Aestuariimicrobium sp. p3-SID1156]|uniref:phosphoserine phosphatase SerB n=1 Tax=Aestuariimicrobium sp. p3-SID1156 TaxID=2916038 RepID=UPI00223AFFED|nr:phosphoserine phosphatase SerB [Aestuariimicrobium sp. p3-SID1156]MCT1458322.1 phosphoserine phosphatase SerB [Aestuariimicrobium sp. p3-SID1156]
MSALDQALDQLEPPARTILIGEGLPPAGLDHARRHDWGWSVDQVQGDVELPMVDRGRVREPLSLRPPKLLVLDVDSTLTTSEAIDLLAEHAGLGEKVAEITERAMQGELDFAQSLIERVACLEGLPVSVLDEVREQIAFQPGAAALVEAIHAAGGKVGVVSGGFIEIVQPLVDQLGIDYATANTLEISPEGALTGRITGPVIDREAKAATLQHYCELAGCAVEESVAIGDGANDLLMLSRAGLGIAYCAKPVTAEQADATISFPRLDAALGYLVMD